MDRESTLYEVARYCRGSHRATLWALGYLAVGLQPEELKQLLEGVREVLQADDPATLNHIEAYRERWGRPPGRS